MSKDLAALVEAANAPLTDPAMNRVVGEGPPRFELYHFALSLCSQKVRACLAEKGATYVAHDINLQMPLLGNYDPAYVRLRLEADPGNGFATGYSGRSSVATEGFDPAVVPTLVDHGAGQVVADSLRICRHVDAVTEPEGALVPGDLAAAVEAELAVVDGTPHVAVLYGAHPEIDFRPERLRKGMPGVHDRKIAKIRAAREAAVDDARLVAAYDAKIAKEEAGKAYVTTPEKMRASVTELLEIVGALETRFADGRDWVCGERFTLADVVWAVSLFRMKWIGMAFAWEGGHTLNETARPAVARYAETLFDRPAFRASVIDWPGLPRTEYVTEYYDD